MAGHFSSWRNISPEQLGEIMGRLKPDAKDQDHHPAPQPDQPEPDSGSQPLGEVADAQGHAKKSSPRPAGTGIDEGSAGTGDEIAEKIEGRYLIVYTDYRLRLLDYDNLYGGTKTTTDCIRYARLIPEDNPQNLEILVRQIQVTDPKDIRLVIDITRIEPNWTIEATFQLSELIARMMINDLTVLQDLKKLMTP